MGFDGLQPAGLVIKESEIVLHVADEPYFVVDLLDADLLCRKSACRVFDSPPGHQLSWLGYECCRSLTNVLVPDIGHSGSAPLLAVNAAW